MVYRLEYNIYHKYWVNMAYRLVNTIYPKCLSKYGLQSGI